jgi:hypothetical protein
MLRGEILIYTLFIRTSCKRVDTTRCVLFLAHYSSYFSTFVARRQVQTNELWAIIGAKMGFVQFPGTDGEPAKSGPGVAQRLAMVYKEYLGAFDMVYINSVFESRKKLHAAQAVQRQQIAHAAATGGSGNDHLSQQHMMQQNRGALTPHQMQLVIGYANQSVAELRAQGVQERIIQFVETNRAHLQRTVMEQGMFRGQFQLNQASRGPQDQHGSPSGGIGFTSPNAQPNTGVNPTPRQFMPPPHNGMQGINFMDNRSQQPPSGFQFPIGRPTKEQIQNAMAFIMKTKTEFSKLSKHSIASILLPVLNHCFRSASNARYGYSE